MLKVQTESHCSLARITSEKYNICSGLLLSLILNNLWPTMRIYLNLKLDKIFIYFYFRVNFMCVKIFSQEIFTIAVIKSKCFK